MTKEDVFVPILENIKNEDINIIDEYTYEVYNISNSIKKGSKLKKVIYNYKNVEYYLHM